MSKKLVLSLLLCILSAGLAQADVVVVENAGGTWSAQTVLSGNHSDVCMNLWPNQYMAVGSGGADAIYKDGTWKSIHASSTPYTAVVGNALSYDQFIAARTAGGVDYIPWNSASDTGITTSYTKLAKNQQNNCYFGITSAGGLTEVYNSGGWKTYPVSNPAGYTQIASNNLVNQFFALNSSGIDLFYYHPTNDWSSRVVATGNFSILAGDDQATDTAFAAGSNGLTYISYSAGNYQTQQISGTIYTALASIGGSTEGVFAARASGGIDRIYWDGTQFVTETILTEGLFSKLAGDYDDPNVLMAIEVPEPATMSLLVLGGLGVLLRRRK